MRLADYQAKAARTLGESGERGLAAYGMGLSGEAGEVTDYLKKVIFHGHPMDRDRLEKELGDVLWYLTGIATVEGLFLEQIAQKNLDKLRQRYPKGFSQEASRTRVDDARPTDIDGLLPPEED